MTAGIAHRFPVDLRNGFCIRVQQDGGALRAYLDLSDATLTEGLQASTAMSLVYEAATGKVGFLPYAAGGGGDASFPSGGAAGQVLRVATASPRALEWGDTDTAIVATGDGQNTELRLLGRRDGAQTQSVRTGPQTVVHSPAPALGNATTRGSLVVQAETVEETRAEFLGSYHLLSTKGKSSPHGSADKVALFAGATGRLGSSDLWSLNTVVTADAGAGDITLMGYELDCNNQSRHYGDAFGPAGAVAERNFYGLLITGVGTYRKTAAVAITDVVDGAWNRGIVAITGAISATGSFIQDLCNGHQASIDILGAPTYGVRQTSATTKNWFNGSSVFGGQGIVDPAAKLHVEAGALGGGAGQSIEIFRAGAEAGPNGSDRTHLRLTAFRTANGATANTALLRVRSFVNETGGAWLDFSPGGRFAIANAGGAALAIGADRTLDASGNRLTGLPAPVAASDAATKAYVDAAGGGGGKDVLSYGAKGDGVTDDTAAFQAMFNETGGVLIPPGKNFYITGRVGALSQTKGGQFVGAGPDRTFVTFGPDGGFDIGGEHSRVEGVTFFAKGAVKQAIRSDPLNFSSVYGLLRKLNFQSGAAADYFIICMDLYKYWYCSIEDCQFRNFLNDDTARGAGIKWHYSTNNTVTGCTFAGFYNAYWVTADTHPTEGNTCEGHNVSNNIWVKNGANVQIDGGLYMAFVNNTIDLNYNGRPGFFSNASNTVLIGNWFGNMPNVDTAQRLGAPVWLEGDLAVVQGNIFYGRPQFGKLLIFNQMVGALVSGNVFDQATEAIGAVNPVSDFSIYGNAFNGQSYENGTTAPCVNLSNISNLTWFGNTYRLTGTPILPSGYKGADGVPPSGGSQSAVYATSAVVSVTTTAPFQDYNAAIPSGRFGARPIATASLANAGSYEVSIDFDNCSATNIRFRLRNSAGGALSGGDTVRVNLIATAQS